MKRSGLWPSVCRLENAGGTLAHAGCAEQKDFEQILKSPWFGREAVERGWSCSKAMAAAGFPG